MAFAVQKFSSENHNFSNVESSASVGDASGLELAPSILPQESLPKANLVLIHEKHEAANDSNFVDSLDKFVNSGTRPVFISGIGAALHFLDSFIEGSKLPDSIKKLSLNASIWYSKLVTVLPNAIKGVRLIAENDFFDGASRIYSLVGKLFQSKPANFSISSGFFPGVQMVKFVIGKEKYESQNFKSFGENISFFLQGLKESISSSWGKIKRGEDVLENFLKAVVPTGLISSSLLGSATIGDEVSTPKARFIGFIRNFSGAGGDLLLLMKAYKDAVLEHGKEKALSEVFKSTDFKVGFPYILASLGELVNRYLPEPFQSRFAQLLCGANETISAYWGMTSGKKKETSS